MYIWNRILKKLRGSAIRNSNIHKTSKVEAGSQVINTNMGRYSYCGYDCKLLNCDIGAFCSIADNVIIGGAQHPMDWVSTSPVFYKGRDSVRKKFQKFERTTVNRTVIENDVWIGERALIKAGVKIGNGAVIGMGSVVTKDIGQYEVWAGNPAMLIKNRFSDSIAEELNNSLWWNESDGIINNASKFIKNPKEFLNHI